MRVSNLISDDVICSCCMADRQFPHHNMGPYGPLVRLIDRWMTPMRTSRPSPEEPGMEWQPVCSQRASLNLKVISLTRSFSLSALLVPLLLLLGLFLLFLALALSLSLPLSCLLNAFSEISFFSGYFLPPLKASVFFHCLSSSPLSPLDSVCHCSVLFSIPVSPSLKEQLDCLSRLSLKSELGWKVCKAVSNRHRFVWEREPVWLQGWYSLLFSLDISLSPLLSMFSFALTHS